ncbi:MAG TPA: BON domain-containing protein [Longimicrobiales bacterium]|nr:BON domain-containing protein [Longimicrobiales bacterium]
MFGREGLHRDARSAVDRVPFWLVATAAVAGASAVAYGVIRLTRARARREAPSELDAFELAAVDRLRRDAVTGRSPIEVAALAPGLVELTGTVPTHDVGQRAARLLHALPGVHTVINRLDTGSLEQRLATNRAQHAAANGAPRASAPADNATTPEMERTSATAAAAHAHE